MTSLRSFFGGVGALALASTSVHAGNRVEGIWDDRWLGGYGDWLPLVIAAIICVAIWLAKRHQKR